MSLENYPSFLLNFSENEMNGAEKCFYRFKSFRLDVEERQLLQNNLPLSLTPKAFNVLVALVEQSGHLVEKEEMMRTIWADSFVEEANIARIIHTLRKILGEDESGNKFIETIPTRGYRFIAEVSKEYTPVDSSAKDRSREILPDFEIDEQVSNLVKPELAGLDARLRFLQSQ